MKRDALVRSLRRYATKNNLPFELDKAGGKGSHYRLRLGDAITTAPSGGTDAAARQPHMQATRR